jgi:hypothetical protein
MCKEFKNGKCTNCGAPPHTIHCNRWSTLQRGNKIHENFQEFWEKVLGGRTFDEYQMEFLKEMQNNPVMGIRNKGVSLGRRPNYDNNMEIMELSIVDIPKKIGGQKPKWIFMDDPLDDDNYNIDERVFKVMGFEIGLKKFIRWSIFFFLVGITAGFFITAYLIREGYVR